MTDPRRRADGSPRYRLTVPAYANYTYEVYSNPTLADLEWKALSFSLTQAGAIDRHKPHREGFYAVSFRVPGANTGTP